VQEATLHQVALHSNQRDLGLPAAVQTRFEQTHRLLMKKDLHGALRLAEALAASHPGYPILVGNIAHIKEALGHDVDEIEALFQHAAALDPAYLFAQLGLARVAVRRGNLQAARALLKSVQDRPEYHFSEWRSILATERDILVAEGNVALVRRIDFALDEIAGRFG
jgi:predicted Zn-dependent protease